MNTKKMIAVMAVLAMAVAAFAFVPVGGISGDDEKYVEMKGDFTSELTLTGEQTVVVVDDLNIINGGKLTILGDFIVKEGKTVTIEGEGSQLMLYGDATIDGNIISKIGDKTDDTKAGLIIAPGTNATDANKTFTVTINGTVTALGDTSGEAVISAKLASDYNKKNINVNGNFVIGTNAEVTIDYALFEKNSALTVLGSVNGYIGLLGSANFDGASTNGFTVHIADAAAKIEVVSFSGTLTVTDVTMFAYAYGGVQYYVQNPAPFMPTTTPYAAAIAELVTDDDDKLVEDNWVVLTNVTNIKIAETITTFMDYDEDNSKNMMCAETKMIISPLDSAKTVAAVDGSSSAEIEVQTGSETVYLETMTIVDIDVDINGEATVVGDITFPVSNPVKTFDVDTTEGKLTVVGLVLIKNATIVGESAVDAAKYTIKDADNKVDAYYTTVQKAIDSEATDIIMMGQLVVEKDLTIPAPVKLTTAETLTTTPATAEADCAVVVKEGATFTIANGAQFIAKGDVDVEGAFVIENIDYGITLKLIWADVELKDGSYIMYTNLANAFVKAEAGAELCAYNPVNRTISIKDDLILPAGMSFSNYSEYNSAAVTVAIDNGATFTIAGKLIVNEKSDLSAVGGNSWNSKTPATDAGAVKDYSVIVIGAQGVIEFTTGDAPAYSDFKIAGAYYTMDGKSYIANIPLAFGLILDTDACTVDVAGEVAIENIKVAGTEKDRIIVNIVTGADVTMKGFTFAYGTINAAATAVLSGDIGTATGKIVFDEATVTADAIFTEKFLNDAMNLAVSGEFTSENTASVSGIVFISDFDYIGEAELEEGFVAIDDSKFIVPAGAQLFVYGETADDEMTVGEAEFIVEGTVVVTNSGKLMADIVSVIGTFTVEKVDGKSGVATVDTYIVGGTTDSFNGVALDTTTGAATINGAGSFAALDNASALVFNGANVSADVMADWMKADTTKSTQFYVEGSLWMTAYAGKNVDLLIYQYDGDVYNFEPAIDNVWFYDWQIYDEKTKTYADIDDIVEEDVNVGDAGYEKLYAEFKKDIYYIVVTADVGIDNVYIDGVIMTKNGGDNTFNMNVAAGTHTITYELANGYSGNAYITSIDGVKLVGSGLTFTVNDDKYDETREVMDITLSGIVKSGYDVDPETHEEKSTGLTVTEILLIVVVIIMAIMAVVLILRLNRS